MSVSFTSLLSRARALLNGLQWAGPLLVRISLASVFIVTGRAHLKDLDGLTAHFIEWKIPMPGLNAGISSTVELVGGILLLLGLFTRFAAIPMAFCMLVAIAAARRGDIDGVATLFAFNEFTYFACFVWLLVAGAGSASLDRLLFGRWVKSFPGPAPSPERG
jgi:putative oxidoreductase